MSRIAPNSFGVVANLSTTTNAAQTLDRIAAAPQPTTRARDNRTKTLAIQQGNWNDKVDAASLARLGPRALVERFIKNGLIEIDTGRNQSINKQLVKDLIDIAATPVGRQTLLGAVKDRQGDARLTPFSIKVMADAEGETDNQNGITLGTKLFAEDCHLVGDTVSSARSLFTLFHELVHVNQYKAQSKMTFDQTEDDATRRTDVFVTQFNRANGTNYPKRITYGKKTDLVCPVSSSKKVMTPEQLKKEIQSIKVDPTMKNLTQSGFASAVLDGTLEKMEALVRIEFGSDTLRAPGGSGRRKQALDSLLTIRSAMAQMRNDKPLDSAQMARLVQTYTAVYKSFFNAMSIDNLPSLPRRQNGSLVKQ